MISYDQKTHLSIICPTIWEIDSVFNGKSTWYSLENVLEFWLGQIREGRIIAVAEDAGQDHVQYDSMQRFEPWVFIPNNNTMLDDNINAFNQLVKAIETRMPTNGATDGEPSEHSLIEESVIQSTQLPRRFAYEFLRSASALGVPGSG